MYERERASRNFLRWMLVGDFFLSIFYAAKRRGYYVGLIATGNQRLCCNEIKKSVHTHTHTHARALAVRDEGSRIHKTFTSVVRRRTQKGRQQRKLDIFFCSLESSFTSLAGFVFFPFDLGFLWSKSVRM